MTPAIWEKKVPWESTLLIRAPATLIRSKQNTLNVLSNSATLRDTFGKPESRWESQRYLHEWMFCMKIKDEKTLASTRRVRILWSRCHIKRPTLKAVGDSLEKARKITGTEADAVNWWMIVCFWSLLFNFVSSFKNSDFGQVYFTDHFTGWLQENPKDDESPL